MNQKLESFSVVKERQSFHQQTEEWPSPGPEIQAPQDRQSDRFCLSEMRHDGGEC